MVKIAIRLPPLVLQTFAPFSQNPQIIPNPHQQHIRVDYTQQSWVWFSPLVMLRGVLPPSPQALCGQDCTPQPCLTRNCCLASFLCMQLWFLALEKSRTTRLSAEMPCSERL